MTLSITDRAALEAKRVRLEPQLVLEIEGVVTLFGAVEILRLIRIGDPGLLIGEEWRIGGLTPVEDQEDIISIDAGGGTKIDQQIQPDRGTGSSVTSVQVALIDRNLIATRLISPGIVIDDIMGAKCTLWMGFKTTAFKEDYVRIISGIIDDIDSGAGVVKLNISHPEQIKRQELFEPVNVLLSATATDSDTSLVFVTTDGVPLRYFGPDDATFDPAFRTFVQIEDEIIEYTNVVANVFTGCIRGSLGTVAVAHTVTSEPIEGKTMVQIEGTAIEVALKLMLSGKRGPYVEDVPVGRFLHPTPLTTLAGSIFFDGIDLNRDYGVTEGDYVDISGASNPANNNTKKIIQRLEVVDGGSFIVVGAVSFVEEPGTSAVVSFRSQYDSLGTGLAMSPDQVDVNEHIFWNNFQLASYSYRFVLRDKIKVKDFLDKEVYLPVGAFSLPRQGRCSMGYHVGAVVRDKLITISRDNVKDPDKIRLRRTINRNFYNVVTYQFEEIALTGKFVRGSIEYSVESQNRIKVGNKPLSITSKGLRSDLDGAGIAERVSARYLGRYKFAAEFIETIGLLFKDGYTIEPGDVVLLDSTGLQISNTVDGTRNKPPKVFAVLNKSLYLKTGDVKLALTDTNFDETEKYGAVSPSSVIVSGDTTSILIQDSFGSLFPGNEGKKWEDYAGLPILVHSDDWFYEEEVTLLGVDPSNSYRLLLDPSTPLSGAPSAGFIVDVGRYPTGTDPLENALYKAVHAFLSPTVTLVDAADDTHFEVGGGDIAKFYVDGLVRIRNSDFSDDSGELTITDVTGNIVTVSSSMGFTPGAGYKAESLGFADGGKTYRLF